MHNMLVEVEEKNNHKQSIQWYYNVKLSLEAKINIMQFKRSLTGNNKVKAGKNLQTKICAICRSKRRKQIQSGQSNSIAM